MFTKQLIPIIFMLAVFLQGCVTNTQSLDINSFSQSSNFNGILFSQDNGVKLALFSTDLTSEHFMHISKQTVGSCRESNCEKFNDKSIDWIKTQVQHKAANRYYPFIAKVQSLKISQKVESYFSIEPNFPVSEDIDEKAAMSGPGSDTFA